MRNIYRSLLMVLAGATQKKVACHVRYLKVENQILRSKLPKRIAVTEQERNRRIRFAQNLGSKTANELATIVRLGTIRRWIREQSKRRKVKPAKVGRKRTAAEIEKSCEGASAQTSGRPPWCYFSLRSGYKQRRIRRGRWNAG